MFLPYLISTYIMKKKNEENNISTMIKSKKKVKYLLIYTEWFSKDNKNIVLSETCELVRSQPNVE